MPASPPAEHVFVSFSSVDKAEVERLAQRLEDSGIPLWVDFKGIAAGSHDWELAIRDALDRSYAVLLIASPSSRQSLAVRGELSVAQSRRLTIYPLWLTGDDWIDCVPLELAHSQYVDCRSSSFDIGLRRITEQLSQDIKRLATPHYLASRASKSSPGRRRSSWNGIEIPSSSILVELPRIDVQGGDREDRAVILNLLAYDSIQALLDEFYISYLHDLYKPFTYGDSWVLVEAFGGCRILVDWSWLSRTRTYYPPADLVEELPQGSLLAESPFWSVRDVTGLVAYGLAVHDKRILDIWGQNPKRTLFLEDRFAVVSVDGFDLSKHEFRAVFRGPPRIAGQDQTGGRAVVLKQVDPLTAEEEARLFPARR